MQDAKRSLCQDFMALPIFICASPESTQENNHLREIVHAHKGIIDMHGSVSHIFDSDMHAASIVRHGGTGSSESIPDACLL